MGLIISLKSFNYALANKVWLSQGLIVEASLLPSISSGKAENHA